MTSPDFNNYNLPAHFKWLTHKGKRILLNNYQNLPSVQSVPLIIEGREFITGMGRPGLKILINTFGTEMTKETQIEFKKASVECKPLIQKVAVVGMTPLKHILLSAINKFSGIGAKPFKTENEAKDWLVAD